MSFMSTISPALWYILFSYQSSLESVAQANSKSSLIRRIISNKIIFHKVAHISTVHFCKFVSLFLIYFHNLILSIYTLWKYSLLGFVIIYYALIICEFISFISSTDTPTI